MPESLPSALEQDRLKTTAIAAAMTAGKIILDYARTGFRVSHKDVVNLVTDADRAAEQAIVETIRLAYPSHRILAEERGQETGGDSPYQWVVDPLDGTTNFAHRFPVYCVSIGLECRGRMLLGVVFDPTRDELFLGEADRGATLNGESIRVSATATLDASLLVTGFAYDIRHATHNNLDYFSQFALRAQGVRRTGAAALDLCYVAAGRFDGFWEMKLHPWDMAAGTLIVTEAGGRVTDFSNGPFSIYGPELIASNGAIHEAMVEVLAKERPT